MFTRDDLITYLSDIEITEINMRDMYTEAVKYIDDEDILKRFNFLVSAEKKHATLVSGLKKEVMGLSIVEKK